MVGARNVVEPIDAREAGALLGALLGALTILFFVHLLWVTVRDMRRRRGDHAMLCRRMHFSIGVLLLAFSAVTYNMAYIVFWKMGWGDPPRGHWAFEIGHWTRFAGFAMVNRVAIEGIYKRRVWLIWIGSIIIAFGAAIAF